MDSCVGKWVWMDGLDRIGWVGGWMDEWMRFSVSVPSEASL